MAMQRAELSLIELIEKYSNPATPYPSTPWLDKGAKYDDYRHLARIGEWLYS